MSRNFTRTYRSFFGLLGLAAMSVQAYYSRYFLVEFFSYFTVLSNLFTIVLFLYLAWAAPKKLRLQLEWTRGAVTLSMTITGIVYWTLLRNNPDLAAFPWINTVAHGIMPIAVVLDWLRNPPNVRFSKSVAFSWLAFPLLFLLYSLIRGHLVGWYPYFFVNPERVGYEGVIKYAVLILVGAWILALGLIHIPKWLSNRK